MEKAIIVKKGHDDYNGLKWVTKAVRINPEGDEEDDALTRIQVQDHAATGCDGHRLHEYTLIAPEDFPNGLYRPFEVKKNLILIFDQTLDLEFPKFDSIFPNEQPLKELDVTAGKGPLFDWAYAEILRNIPSSHIYPIDQLKDLMLGNINWKAHLFGQNKPCLFLSLNKRGLIMPYRPEGK